MKESIKRIIRKHLSERCRKKIHTLLLKLDKLMSTNKRIYQIGFNKAGTKSLCYYLEKNGIPTIHYDKGKLSSTIIRNAKAGRPLFYEYEAFQGFTDMEHMTDNGQQRYASEEFFEQMYNEDPDGLFILNVRPIVDWINSRAKHGRYLIRAMEAHNKTEEEIFAMWREEFITHVEKVSRFFAGKDNFLMFDLSKHDGQYLTDFFKRHGFNFKARHWEHRGRSGSKHIKAIRKAAIYFKKKGNLEDAINLMKIAEKHNQDSTCMYDKAEKREKLRREVSVENVPSAVKPETQTLKL
ncbi:hypothetical protein MHK_009104 [Candidatus Magnetomorum sp. HK-1]|nr:hypothetical protein MHK_009104 [Candidatus Magnetomorum sp. HK-1]